MWLSFSNVYRFSIVFTQWTHNLDLTQVRRSYNAQDILCKSFVRSIWVVCLRGIINLKHILHFYLVIYF